MPSVISPVMWKINPPIIMKGKHPRCDRSHRDYRHARFQWRIGFCVLNGVACFVRGDAERGDRGRVVNIR